MTQTHGHDPAEFVAGLGQKLASRGRRVAFLLGAGVSRACGLPDVGGLQDEVLTALSDDERERFAGLLEANNLEQALSRLRRIQALLDGDETVGGITADQAASLDRSVCAAVVNALRLDRADLGAMADFARWIVRSDYLEALELFTVNYDLLVESALELERALFFDGFVGVYQARFQVDLVEELPLGERVAMPAQFARLWKLHGSLNWVWAGTTPNEVLRLGTAAPSDATAAIYPADTKYEESRRVPFVVLQDRFRRVLHRPESLVLVAGCSFSDDDLNELIFDAARQRPRSEFLAFFYGELPQHVANEAELVPNLSLVAPTEAVLGGQRAEWLDPETELPGVWETGRFVLGDFARLANYLAKSLPPTLASAIDDG